MAELPRQSDAGDRIGVLRHWLEADEKPRCQHCPCLADERSFMCEDCAGQADEEVQTLDDQLAGAVRALEYIRDVNTALDPERVDWRRTAEIMREKAIVALGEAVQEERSNG